MILRISDVVVVCMQVVVWQCRLGHLTTGTQQQQATAQVFDHTAVATKRNTNSMIYWPCFPYITSFAQVGFGMYRQLHRRMQCRTIYVSQIVLCSMHTICIFESRAHHVWPLYESN